MSAADYYFVTIWRFNADVRSVADILKDAEAFARWWPAVYLEVRELEPGDGNQVGAVYDLYTKGWLPYTLRWTCRVTDADYPNGFALEAWGDFVGRGIWTLRQAGEDVLVRYDWRVRAGKPLLQRWSYLLRPVFRWNHEWAMRTGERSLRLELARRVASTPAERRALPPPPAPSFARFVKPGALDSTPPKNTAAKRAAN